MPLTSGPKMRLQPGGRPRRSCKNTGKRSGRLGNALACIESARAHHCRTASLTSSSTMRVCANRPTPIGASPSVVSGRRRGAPKIGPRQHAALAARSGWSFGNRLRTRLRSRSSRGTVTEQMLSSHVRRPASRQIADRLPRSQSVLPRPAICLFAPSADFSGEYIADDDQAAGVSR